MFPITLIVAAWTGATSTTANASVASNPVFHFMIRESPCGLLGDSTSAEMLSSVVERCLV
jgi:hypothetical protein